MRIGIALVVLPWLLAACAQPTLPATNQTLTLRGEWKSESVQSSYREWKGITDCRFFVYEDKALPQSKPGSSGSPLLAELIVNKDGTNQLAADTQPVFATADKLFIGPIGSCYRFDYSVTNNALHLNLAAEDGGYLRIRFRRISNEPGKPRFPQASTRWR